MKGHASIEHLSGYLDAALAESEHQRVESHLSACDECRRRLEGLRRVIGEMHHLQRTAPPADLRQQLGWRLAAEAQRPDWRARLDGALGSLRADASLIHLFAVVVALGTILYLLAVALDYRTSATSPEPAVPRVEAVRASAVVTLPAVGDRWFDRYDGEWRERGLEPSGEVEVVDPESAAGRVWIEARPQLEPLARLGGAVVVEVDGRPVRLLFPRSQR